jgi:predicted nucleotidyltransferase
MLDIKRILKSLNAHKVKYIIAGGTAAIARGSVHLTFDFDICYARNKENLENLVKALTPFHPHLRGAPEDLPFIFDAKTLHQGLNFTFSTDVGDIDLIGELSGIGYYDEVLKLSEETEIYNQRCYVLTLEGLIQNKKALGREKDVALLKELEALREIRKQQEKKKNI